jgi:hypothetical protein
MDAVEIALVEAIFDRAKLGSLGCRSVKECTSVWIRRQRSNVGLRV